MVSQGAGGTGAEKAECWPLFGDLRRIASPVLVPGSLNQVPNCRVPRYDSSEITITHPELEARHVTTEPIGVRTDKKKLRQLDKLAKQMNRSRNYIVNQAIDQLLDVYAWQDEQARAGIRAADKGEFASDAEMDRIFGKHGSN